MAAAPVFATTGRTELGQVSAANTARDGTGTIVTCITAGASGSIVRRIRIKAENDPADCCVTIFRHDGANARIFDEFDLGNPAAGSATSATYSDERVYDEWFLAAGHSVRAAITAAPTAGVVDVWVTVLDL